MSLFKIYFTDSYIKSSKDNNYKKSINKNLLINRIYDTNFIINLFYNNYNNRKIEKFIKYSVKIIYINVDKTSERICIRT
jgi:capsule polysaccharide export protein KpsE/RkpR